MRDNLTIIILAFCTLLLAVIYGVYLSIAGNYEETNSKILARDENVIKNLEEDDVYEYDKQVVDGETVIDIILKWQNTYAVYVKTPSFVKKYYHDNPFVKNMPNNLDYINIDHKYNVYVHVFKDKTGKIIGPKNSVTGRTLEPLIEIDDATSEEYAKNDDGRLHINDLDDNNVAFVQYTESGEFKVPDGVNKIQLYACGSGKGTSAGNFEAQENFSSGGTIYISSNRNLRTISISITYRGDTVVKYHNQNNALKTLTFRGGALDHHVNGITLATGANTFIGGQDGARGQNGYINGQSVDDATENYCKGGKGGIGGAFGFGGGGGAGASIDTLAQVVKENSPDPANADPATYSTPEVTAALGGAYIDAIAGHNSHTNNATANLANKTQAILGLGGKGSKGQDKYSVKVSKTLAGSDGLNGTVYKGGNGGITQQLVLPNTYKLPFPGLVDNSSTLAKECFSRAVGAGGGGGAGGYGAGGGQGGYGVSEKLVDGDKVLTGYLYKLANNFEFTTRLHVTGVGDLYEMFVPMEIENGQDGEPSGGMVYMICSK
jgi:hypothetical protein